MNKLFVNRKKMCPMTFKSTISGELLGHFRVAVHVSFADLQDLYVPVRRCRNDAENDPELEPLMACRYPGAEAESRDGHHTILVPLGVNSRGHLSTVANFTFSCLNTCRSIKRLNKKTGKFEKRALKLHVRLETWR
jgi:P53 DNA-binding domain